MLRVEGAEKEPCFLRVLAIILGLICVVGLVWATFGAKWFYMFLWMYTGLTVIFLLLSGPLKAKLVQSFSLIFLVLTIIYILLIAFVIIFVSVAYANSKDERANYETCLSVCDMIPDSDLKKACISKCDKADFNFTYTTNKFAFIMAFLIINLLQQTIFALYVCKRRA